MFGDIIGDKSRYNEKSYVQSYTAAVPHNNIYACQLEISEQMYWVVRKVLNK